MQNSIKNIALVALSVVFIIASTGVFFIDHHCNESGVTDYHFKKVHVCECGTEKNICCTQDADKHISENKPFGISEKHIYSPAFGSNDDCCSFKKFFIKLAIPFNTTSLKLKFFDVQLFIGILNSIYVSFTENTCFSEIIKRPPELLLPVFLRNNILRL